MASLNLTTAAAASSLLSSAAAAATTKLSSTSVHSVKFLQSSPLISHLFLPKKRAVWKGSSSYSTVTVTPKYFALDPEQLKNAMEDIKDILLFSIVPNPNPH